MKDEAVENGRGEIDLRIAAAIDEGIHAGAAGTSKEAEDADGQVFQPDSDDRLVCREQMVYRYGPEAEDKGSGQGQGRDDFKDGHDDLADPAVLAGADVLADHGRTGCVDGVRNEVGCTRQLIGNTGKGRYGDAIRVDPGADEELGELD